VTAIAELRGAGRSFPGVPAVEALRPTTLRLDEGDYVTVVGPSGSGKSTLLNVLGLLDRPSAGTYLLDGVDTGTMSERHLTAIRGQWIGFVFQSFHLLAYRSALENVALAGLYAGVTSRERFERADDLLARVGLAHRRDALPALMSGGERQRVAIARAVSHRPRILLCDEPTGALDSVSGANILTLLDELHADGLTLVVITHDLDVAARGTRRLAIRDGVVRDA
jgi:putative ABC transport system ATP-binding protein